jgi:hypothetical protein
MRDPHRRTGDSLRPHECPSSTGVPPRVPREYPVSTSSAHLATCCRCCKIENWTSACIARTCVVHVGERAALHMEWAPSRLGPSQPERGAPHPVSARRRAALQAPAAAAAPAQPAASNQIPIPRLPLLRSVLSAPRALLALRWATRSEAKRRPRRRPTPTPSLSSPSPAAAPQQRARACVCAVMHQARAPPSNPSGNMPPAAVHVQPIHLSIHPPVARECGRACASSTDTACEYCALISCCVSSSRCTCSQNPAPMGVLRVLCLVEPLMGTGVRVGDRRPCAAEHRAARDRRAV